MSSFNGAYVRRQEMVATEEELEEHGSKVLLENEKLYVRRNDGTLRIKIGDGVTPASSLPFLTVFDEKNFDKTIASIEEAERDAVEHIASLAEGAYDIVQNIGGSETAVMSQRAVTDELYEAEEIDLSQYNFGQGTLYHGNFASDVQRCATQDFIPINNANKVIAVPQDGYKYAIEFHDRNKAFFITTGWVTTKYYDVPKNATYMRVVIAYTNDATITPDIAIDKVEVSLYSSKIDSNSDLIAYAENRMKFIESEHCIIQPVEFVVGNGRAHSSLVDQILLSRKAGEKYYVTVKSNAVTNVLLYEYDASGNSGSRGWFTTNKTQEFTAQKDVNAIGIYLENAAGGDETFVFSCYIPETVSSSMIQKFKDEVYGMVSGSGLPGYWVDHLEDKVLEVNNNSSSCALQGDSFVFFTDYHIEQNSARSHLLMKDIVDKTTVKKIFFGGDIYNGSATKEEINEKAFEFTNRFNGLSMYGARGNHEYNWNDGGSVAVQLTNGEIYNMLLKNVEDNVVTNGALSCYLDNKNQKIRYIVFDSHYENDTEIIPQSELEWLQERLTELDETWTVVVFTHIVFGMSYSAAQSGVVNYIPNGQRIVNAINSVKGNMSATLACLICGHVHYDYSNTDNGYLIITTTCDGKQEGGSWSGWNEGAGTILEHAFDVFSIDTKNKTIKTIRIGRGENREWSY